MCLKVRNNSRFYTIKLISENYVKYVPCFYSENYSESVGYKGGRTGINYFSRNKLVV